MESIFYAIGRVFEAFVNNGAATQALACFFMSIILTIALVVLAMRNSKGHSVAAQEIHKSLGKLSENITNINTANTQIVNAVHELQGDMEKHHDIVMETLVRPKLAKKEKIVDEPVNN
jgi:hypothetical protein